MKVTLLLIALLCATPIVWGSSPITAVRVAGARFTINNSFASLRGFTHIGLLNPQPTICTSTITSCCSLAEENAAWNNFSPTQINITRDYWKANNVRIQVSTILLDPTSSDYSASYKTAVLNGIQMIRAAGLSVQLTMQYQSDSRISCTGQSGAANSTRTLNAWMNIAPSLTSDLGIMFNLLNEPPFGGFCGIFSAWPQWSAVFQPMIDYLRTTLGATNVIIVEGMGQGRVIDQSYNGVNTSKPGYSLMDFPLTDPINQTAYGSHPKPSLYPPNNNTCSYYTFITTADLERNIGILARRATFPIILTEWNSAGGDPAGKTDNSNKCWDNAASIWNNAAGIPFGYTAAGPRPYTPSIVQTMISWLITAGPSNSPLSFTGVWGFDNGVQDNNQDYTWMNPTIFNSTFQCGQLSQGAVNMTYQGHGAIVRNYFTLLDSIEIY